MSIEGQGPYNYFVYILSPVARKPNICSVILSATTNMFSDDCAVPAAIYKEALQTVNVAMYKADCFNKTVLSLNNYHLNIFFV